ncbi:MAG: serine hydrolase domain-containing protein, partial [Chloroflexota bacterium]
MSGKQAIENKVDALFAAWDKPNSPGCALGIVRDGELIYTRGYGSASLEFGVPITPESVFYIASVSKQFTAASIILLSQMGKLSLDDNIRQYLPELPKYNHPITIRHLAHHTSGIRDSLTLMAMAGWNLESRYDNQDAVRFIARQKALNFEPGVTYLYSNSGYILMAEIVSRVSGQSLRKFAQEHIFEPLGMTNTSFDDDRTMVVPNRVTGYGTKENGSFRRYVKNEEAIGDGGVLTTVEDLFRWDQNFFDPKVGGDDFIRKMLGQGKLNNGSVLDYAFGLEHGMYRGLKTVGHGGSFIGFRSRILRFPEQAFTVICLSNLDNFQTLPPLQKIADLYLSDILTPKSTSKTKDIQLARAALQEKVGLYQNTNSGLAAEVFVQDGQLMGDAFGGTFALHPISQTKFQFIGTPTQIE